MDYINLSVLFSSIGTISIILIYIYLYVLYKERYMGLWAASWFVLLARYLIFDTGLVAWKNSIIFLTIYQGLIYISIVLLVWSTYIFINKRFNKLWLFWALGLVLTNLVLNITGSSLFLKLLLPIFFGCFACTWVGVIFLRHLKLPGIGRLITGYSYIFWSLLNLAAPFTLGGSWILSWSYSAGGMLRLFIALGTLMVYLEKTRIDLVVKETQYRLLAENAVDVIYHYHLVPTGKITYISPSVFKITGHTPEEYYTDHRLIFKILHPDDYSVLNKFIRNFPSSLEVPLTLRIIQKNNTILWLEQKCVPLYDDKGHIIALEGIIRDITTRKNLEKISSSYDRMNMVGNMAATVAHEIRNPMTTVRGYLQVLGRKEKNQDDRDKFALMIEEIDRANDIIREYLSLSREKTANFKTCSLNNIIETLFPLIQADANSSKVYVTLALSAIPDLLLDDNEIRQLLLNFIRNSIEAMPDGGELLIRTYTEADSVILTISDQGTGIPVQVLENLGTPFVTTKDTGTGLGLPLCYQIAKRHNAGIKFDTSNAGTTVFVCFNS